MTGRILFDPSFKEALGYCLRDKRVRVSPEVEGPERRSPEAEERDLRQMRNRAEVLYYHMCHGDEKELVRQFKEVQKQDLKIGKPAFHLSLNLPPEDRISKGRFAELARDCARALDFEKHQYVVILHKDTKHPHIHLVVNRVGFDGHVMEDKYTLDRVNKFCREAEVRYELRQVKQIYRYRSPEERQERRMNPRVKVLKQHIERALKEVHDLDGLRQRLGVEGYKVYKNERGIAFVDGGVTIQGYKTGYPWKQIEEKLALNMVWHKRRMRDQTLWPEQTQERKLAPRMRIDIE